MRCCWRRKRSAGCCATPTWWRTTPASRRVSLGCELARLFAGQLDQQGVTVTYARVSAVKDEGDAFCLQSDRGAFSARILVIATGSQALTLQDFPIPEAAKSRVLYEILPVLGVEGRRFAIVGAGDLAFDYALNLGKRNAVTILNRGSETRCLPLLRQRAADNPRISYRENTWVEGVRQAPQGELELACRSPQGEISIACDYLVGAIGRKPQLDFLSEDFLRHAAGWQREGRLVSHWGREEPAVPPGIHRHWGWRDGSHANPPEEP